LKQAVILKLTNMADKKPSRKKQGGGFQISPDPVMEGENALPADVEKYFGPPPGHGGEGEQGALPRSYGESTIFLIAQEPHRLFTYWDLDIAEHPGGPAVIRCYQTNAREPEIELEVPFEARNWYLPVTEPGAEYYVEIGYYRDRSWQPLAKSAPARTPSTTWSSDESFDFATLPPDTAFQAMLASLPGSNPAHPELARLLSEWQRSASVVQGENSDQALKSLRAMLGDSLMLEMLSGGSESSELSSRLRDRLEEVLASESSSELLARFQEHAANSSLFSSLFIEEELNSESLTSWAESLVGWSQTARLAAASEWLSSYASGGETSSFPGLGGLSSLSLAQAGWSGEALSSWTPESLSSWARELLSSWSSGESGSWMTSPHGREFFLHVNAEVIFYGGTHPDAKVQIDGKEVPLKPDGSFRFHFVFPDGNYEIPIVATSPDGVETRSAILRFERDTSKKGEVGATAQPPLSEPMGEK